MALLYPIGLLALVGIIIPVLLHLWNVKQGKTLKIGSIALLGENSTSSSKSLKITDWLLFLLRCLIIVLIAFLLTEPYIKKIINNNKNAGWILMDRNQFANVYKTHQQAVDSLLNLGFELRDFNLGFNHFTLKDSLVKSENEIQLSYGSLINQLNKQMPAGNAAYVFADYKLINFDGNLPKPNFKLVWNEVKDTDTLKTWSTQFLHKKYEAKSSPSLTSYTTDQSQDLPSISILIYDPNNADSKYIKAGLNAISDFTKRKIEVKNWNSSSSKADVGFWLSGGKITPSYLTQLKDDANLFTYQVGKILDVNSSIRLNEKSNQAIALKQRIALDELKGTTIWTDGFGVPILIKESKTKINHFHFYSRFNVRWTDLVWNEKFIKALLPIVLANESAADFGFENNPADQRVLDQQQKISSKISVSAVSKTTTHQNLDSIFWLLALVIMVLERILSFKQKTSLANVKS
jgi:hypothetical protein